MPETITCARCFCTITDGEPGPIYQAPPDGMFADDTVCQSCYEQIMAGNEFNRKSLGDQLLDVLGMLQADWTTDWDTGGMDEPVDKRKALGDALLSYLQQILTKSMDHRRVDLIAYAFREMASAQQRLLAEEPDNE